MAVEGMAVDRIGEDHGLVAEGRVDVRQRQNDPIAVTRRDHHDVGHGGPPQRFASRCIHLAEQQQRRNATVDAREAVNGDGHRWCGMVLIAAPSKVTGCAVRPVTLRLCAPATIGTTIASESATVR